MPLRKNCLKLSIASIFEKVNHDTLRCVHPKIISKILVDYEVKVAHNIANHIELATFSHILEDNELARW
jgi:hypothetical protein